MAGSAGQGSLLTLIGGMGLDLFSMASGPAVHVRDLHRALARAGWTAEVLCAGPRQRSMEDAAGFRIRGVGPPRGSVLFPGLLDLQEWMYSRRFAAEGARAARRLRPAFLYERYSLFNLGGVRLSRRLGLPLLLEVNAPLREERRHFRRWRLEWLAAYCERQVLRGATRIVAVSEILARHFAGRGVDPAKIRVIPNGADTRRFHPGLEAEPVRRELGLPADAVVVGHVGTLKPWHGTADLARCLGHALAADPRLHALIVGDGPGLPLLRREASAAGLAGRFTFTGLLPADQIPRLVAAADLHLALYPAGEEFYFSPLKVMEALAGGRPVVATRIGQLAEIVEEGQEGLLVPPGAWEEAAEAILGLAADGERRRRMGRAAAQKAQRKFSWDVVAGRILALAQEAAGSVR